MSTQSRIYLDFNATAPLSDAARRAISDALLDTGNPSSIHAEGRRARDRVERARGQVAALVGRPREQLVFTSGGTEANALGVLALAAAVEQRGLPRVVATTPIEHPSLRGAIAALAQRGWLVRSLPLGEQEPAGLYAVALVNHELGTTLAPGLLDGARARGALIHVDAVQALGKLDLHGVDADSIAISGHKIGGPQGIGALVIGIDTGLPIVDGGHQERGRRPGTENALGIIGFGAAAADISIADWPRVSALGERLEAGLRAIQGVRIHGALDGDRESSATYLGQRVGGTINAGFSNALGESIVMALDLEGISVSTGAACTSGSIQPSAVLLGLGYSEVEAREAVRFSLGRSTTGDEVDRVLALLPRIVARARQHR